jgi:hypothetical protein
MTTILRDIDYDRAVRFIEACQINPDPRIGRKGAAGVAITDDARAVLKEVTAEQMKADQGDLDPDETAWLDLGYEEPARLDPADAFATYVGRLLAAIMFAGIVKSDHRMADIHGRVLECLGSIGSGLSWPAGDAVRRRDERIREMAAAKATSTT